jgi:hypothetical protein
MPNNWLWITDKAAIGLGVSSQDQTVYDKDFHEASQDWSSHLERQERERMMIGNVDARSDRSFQNTGIASPVA